MIIENRDLELLNENSSNVLQSVHERLQESQQTYKGVPVSTHRQSILRLKKTKIILNTSVIENSLDSVQETQIRSRLSSSPISPLLHLPAKSVPQSSITSMLSIPVTPLPDLPTMPSIPVTPLPDLPTISIPAMQQFPARAKVGGFKYQIEQLKVMSSKQRKQYLAFVVVWISVNVYFWRWWFLPNHIGNPILYGLMSAALLYEMTILPSFYTFYLGQMRKPKVVDVANAEATGAIQKVAVISLTVPGSESLEFVKRQMIAMKNIRYPHDSWILVDKEHSPQIQALAERMGVFYFCRHDTTHWGKDRVNYWNQSDPPFKAKTKAGNVNSWIDAYGQLYSHFTQLDIDHIPVPSYLGEVLGFFLDSKVKWVQAPSVYGNTESWTARGSAEQEFVLQGPLQMGFFGFCRTPFIIGSHCTYDMRAIREIGGFQPTRAEDHLDTVFLAAQGYEGVFTPEVIAVGDGPENFETYIGQQFAWAFSMIQVLFTYTASRIKHYTPRQALQFLFVQTWYTFWSTSMFLLFMLPIIALFTNSSIAHENYWRFLLHISPMTDVAFMIWIWSHEWHQPKKLNLSWRGVVLHVARWPIVLSALVQVILKVQKPYMITIKGLQHGTKRPFSLGAHLPYFILISISLIACWFYLRFFGQSPAQGNLLFALQGATIFLLAYIISLFKDLTDMKKEGITFAQYIVLRFKPLSMLVVFLTLLSWTYLLCAGLIYQAITFK